MAKDQDILAEVHRLVAEEQELRAKLQRREIGANEERQHLQSLEVALDRCWDLLRQRRALRETGQDPDLAQLRRAEEVEGYRG